MTDLTFDVGWPLALSGLALVVLLPLLAWKSAFPISRGRLVLVTSLRMLAMALAVLAVAKLRVGFPTDELAIALVVDPSGSIASSERQSTERSFRALAEGAPQFVAPNPRRATRTVEEEFVGATALLRTDRIRRAVLATDGNDPRLAGAIQAARELGVEVSLVPIGDSPRLDEAAVLRVDGPRLVRAEEESDLVVHTRTRAGAAVALHLDDAVVAQLDVPPGDGQTHFHVRFPEDPGMHRLEARLVAATGVTENDQVATLVEVLPKPRVRIYRSEEGPAVLASVLDEAGMEVEVVPPQSAFSEPHAYDPYALVIVDETNPADLGEEQQRALRSWVEEEGGGLVTTTFRHAVRRTPRTFREIEPVIPPPALPEPRPLELIIVIDRSSSMSGAPMEQARQAGIAAVASLRRDARVGVVAFSSLADRVMSPVPMERATEATQFISGIRSGGGTNIAAAISAANRISTPDANYLHHVILISDGESSREPAIAAAMALAGRGVTITTITIGSFSPLLAEIAQIGRGRYHVTNAAGLRSIVTSEAMVRQPPANRTTTFTPSVGARLAMFDGMSFDRIPVVGGHALAGLRPGATQVLGAPEDMPLLAHWHRGLGQVATWTSATSGSWTDGMRQTPFFRELFTKLARGMLRSRTVDPPRIVIEPDPLAESRRLVTVISPFTEDGIIPVVRMTRDRSALAPLELSLRGPGVWQTELDASATLFVDARLPLDHEPTSAQGDERPSDPHLARFGVDHERLARLAEIGGGRVLEGPDEAAASGGQAHVMRGMDVPLLALALLLYILSLVALRWPDKAVARGVEVARASRVSQVPAAPRKDEAA